MNINEMLNGIATNGNDVKESIDNLARSIDIMNYLKIIELRHQLGTLPDDVFDAELDALSRLTADKLV